MKSRLFALAALPAVALAPAASSGLRPGTTAPPPVVNVRITITDSRIDMTPKRGQRGTLARFILRNQGKLPHTITLGHEKRGTGRQTGFTKALKPDQQDILILFLDYRGPIPYFGSLPADRSKPGMKGTFTVF